MTASTRVCCSIISETQTAYAEGCPRQGRVRLWALYQAKSLEARRFMLRRAGFRKICDRIHGIQFREDDPACFHVPFTLTAHNDGILRVRECRESFCREYYETAVLI